MASRNGTATQIEQFLTRHELFTGRFDRLWSRLEAHRIDERVPGDGTRMSNQELNEILSWLNRQTVDTLLYWEKH
jgi:hypothetical protein